MLIGFNIKEGIAVQCSAVHLLSITVTTLSNCFLHCTILLLAISDATPQDMNARSRVHEYGGGQAVAIGNTGDTVTSDFASNALVCTKSDDGQSATQGSTLSGNGPYRYADMTLDPCTATERGNSTRLLFAVREDHTVDEPAHVVNSIVAVSVDDVSEVQQYR
jgi:hypothetical protein